ncbi:MAG TPA: hypothetical protein VF331_22920 [Polyangiales bacterium]
MHGERATPWLLCLLISACSVSHRGQQHADAGSRGDTRASDSGPGDTLAADGSTAGLKTAVARDSGTGDPAVAIDAGPATVTVDPGESQPAADGGSDGTGTLPSGTSDKIDMLFIVDNSPSMREEQAALRDEFPALMAALTTGMRGGKRYAAAAKDLHIGVVSVNMGIIGIQGIGGCSGVTGVGPSGFGDDGLLLHQPSPDPAVTGCKASYPTYLSYVAGQSSPAAVATDFACVATLGSNGCGFEQQMESGLKALWPKLDIDALTGLLHNPNRITFLTDSAHPDGKFGHGDVENQGFLREDSLLVVVLATDEEDCSSATTVHFTPQQYLQPTDPLYNQDLNLRCFYNEQNLYPATRYVHGLQALRSSSELVFFAAITGVPADLTDATGVNLANDAQRNAYYDRMLSDPRMQARPDPTRQPGDGNLVPSCVTPTSNATPPRRIVDVARGFGKNGRVQSICDADFAPAVDAILDMLAPHIAP